MKAEDLPISFFVNLLLGKDKEAKYCRPRSFGAIWPIFLLRSVIQRLGKNPFVSASRYRRYESILTISFCAGLLSLVMLLVGGALLWEKYNRGFGLPFLPLILLFSFGLSGTVISIITEFITGKLQKNEELAMELVREWFTNFESCFSTGIIENWLKSSVDLEEHVHSRLIELAQDVIRYERAEKRHPRQGEDDYIDIALLLSRRNKSRRAMDALWGMFYQSEIVPYGKEYYFSEAKKLLPLEVPEVEKGEPAEMVPEKSLLPEHVEE